MKIIEKGASFSIVCRFTLSETDETVLSLLYLPLVTGTGYSLYRYLLSLAPLSSKKGAFFFEELENALDFSPATILDGFSHLEAIGLVATYRKESLLDGKRKVSFLFRLFPPASPKKFFSDVILRSLLEQKVGSKNYQELSFLFRYSESLPKGFVDVSSKLPEVYSLEEASDKENEEGFEDKSYHNVSEFDSAKLRSLLREEGLLEACKSSFDEIVGLATLYGIKEDEALEIIEKDTDSRKVFHMDSFKEDIRVFRDYRPLARAESNTSYKGRLLSVLSSLSPQEYLAYRLNANPPQYMLEEIEKLSRETHLANPIINVVLDYSLKKTDGKFTPLYIEKVAYSLLGDQIHSAYDAMVYLNSQDAGKKAAKNTRRRKTVVLVGDDKTVDKSLEEKALEAAKRKVRL